MSVEGRSIEAHLSGEPVRDTMIFGGFHGDEPKSVYVVRLFIEHLLDSALIEHLPDSVAAAATHGWVIVPVVNPDGYARRKRRNAGGVDLNRNFPTDNWQAGRKRSRMFGGESPASEPETRAVMDLIERCRPKRILSIHSIGLKRHCNNYDGPGEEDARVMAQHNGYPVTGSIGYPTPGSLGNWAGAERNIATITLELPSHHSPKRCWEENRSGLLRLITLDSGQ